MHAKRRDELVRKVFRLAANAPRDELIAAESRGISHVVDDDELLINWLVGEVTDEQHAQIIAHLADCAACRRELAAMIHAGALILPDAEDTTDQGEETRPVIQMTAAPARFLTPGRHMAGIVAALAAGLLIAIVWVFSDRGGEWLLAMAQRDMQAGNAANAVERVSRYLAQQESTLSNKDVQEAKKLLEESGYVVARRGIQDGDAQQVETSVPLLYCQRTSVPT